MVTGDGWTIEALTTPGHTANHMAYAFKEADLIFSGDHVMAWSTSIVAPPDGAMSDYMASLEKLAKRNEPIYLPGHGGPVRDASRFVHGYIRHRHGREASILRRLGKGAADIPTLVRAIYIGLDPRLVGAASLSVLAHMEDLVARGLVATEGAPSIVGTYRLTELPLPQPERRDFFSLFLSSAFSGFSFFRLRARGRENVIHIFDQRADARSVAAQIVPAIARGGADIDPRAVRRRTHAHHHVLAKAEDWGARNRLDWRLTRGGERPRRTRIDDMPFPLGDDFHHRIVSFLRRRVGQLGFDVRISGVLLLGGVEAGIGDRVGVARPQPRDRFELSADRSGRWSCRRSPAVGRP